jgi:DUF2892 family protein
MNPSIAMKRHARSAQNQTHDDQRRHSSGSAHQQVNVGETERQLSMIGGAVLAAYGLLRGSMSGIALAAIGGALIWRGHTGHCEVYHMLGHSSADQVSGGGNPRSHESHGEHAQSRYFEGHSAE